MKSIDILFNDAELPPVTTSMTPELAALSITLEFAVRFRYQLLEPFADRKPSLLISWTSARRGALLQHALGDKRFKDTSIIRQRIISAFVGEDRAVIQKMYERSDQLWRDDGQGEMDHAIAKGDAKPLQVWSGSSSTCPSVFSRLPRSVLQNSSQVPEVSFPMPKLPRKAYDWALHFASSSSRASARPGRPLLGRRFCVNFGGGHL